jgi:hypothetical protein
MRRPALLTIAALCFALVAATPAAGHNGGANPPQSHAYGASLLTWQKRWMAWAFGSGTNPLLNEVCGEQVGMVFFLTAAEEPGTEVDCRIPPGTPLLATPGGCIIWPFPEETPEEMLEERDACLEELSEPSATLDGRSLGDLDHLLRRTGLYTIALEPGNFIQEVEPENEAVSGDHTLVTSGGWFLRIPPLPPGHHVLVLSDQTEGGLLDITFHLTVR